MKKYIQKSIVLLGSMVLLGLISCAQEPRYAPIYFTKYLWNMSADTLGLIEGQVSVDYLDKEPGEAHVYMIHENGGRWWYQQTKKNFPNARLPFLRAAEQLIKKDSIFLKNYSKWAFYIDRKYLKGESTYGDDPSKLDENGNSRDLTPTELKKTQEQLAYYEKPNTTLEVILYEQKAGSKQWLEIDRRKYKTDQEGNRIYPKGEHWESDFINQKLKESNAHDSGK